MKELAEVVLLVPFLQAVSGADLDKVIMADMVLFLLQGLDFCADLIPEAGDLNGQMGDPVTEDFLDCLG